MAEQRELPLFFVGAEDTPVVFTNLMVVQNLDKEFILTFGQYSPPLLLGKPGEVTEQLDNVPYVPVKVVARVGMTPNRMRELIEILQTNYQGFAERSGDDDA